MYYVNGKYTSLARKIFISQVAIFFFLFGLCPKVTLFLSRKQCSKMCLNNTPQTGYSRRECFRYFSSRGSFKIRFTFKLLPCTASLISTLNFAYAVQTAYTLRSGR